MVPAARLESRISALQPFDAGPKTSKSRKI